MVVRVKIMVASGEWDLGNGWKEAEQSFQGDDKAPYLDGGGQRGSICQNSLSSTFKINAFLKV